MIGPPNAAGGSANAAHNKLSSTQILFPSRAEIKRVWQREAARWFKEYWRTGNETYLRAFSTHVIAMRDHEARWTR